MSVGDFLDNKISDAKNKGQAARYSPSTIERVRGYVESGVISNSLWEGDDWMDASAASDLLEEYRQAS
jgi:hypothetical protein